MNDTALTDVGQMTSEEFNDKYGIDDEDRLLLQMKIRDVLITVQLKEQLSLVHEYVGRANFTFDDCGTAA